MKITITNVQVITDPLTGATADINLEIHSKITLNGDMSIDDDNKQQNRDVITSEIYDNNGVDLTAKFDYYRELKVTESAAYTAAKTAFLEQVKQIYIGFLSQLPTIDPNNVTIEL